MRYLPSKGWQAEGTDGQTVKKREREKEREHAQVKERQGTHYNSPHLTLQISLVTEEKVDHLQVAMLRGSVQSSVASHCSVHLRQGCQTQKKKQKFDYTATKQDVTNRLLKSIGEKPLSSALIRLDFHTALRA